MAVTERKMTIAEAADRVSSWLPRHRAEILRGSLIVSPPLDEQHQGTVFEVGYEIRRAGAREAGLKVRPGIGLWLTTGSADYAIPDLAVVEADIADALVQKNCYAPRVFRMVLEVTSYNWADDTALKVEVYAEAGIPVYLVADRRHDEVLLYTDPADGKYPDPARFKRGQTVPVPESVGVTLDLSVDTLLDGDD
ncbi:Uma2 family endonuclease [Streptomyces sp. NPDC048581]|uniref:Uma2 family endonuclease n=1 Tax=Streptomyces sp. NPDC048581 TaxID=3365572 RepID=UPI00371B6B46